MLEAAPGPNYKAALGIAYGAGLRVSEVAALKVGHIDSTRMLMRVDRGKAARTATRCYRRSCWGCSGCGGAKASAPVSAAPAYCPSHTGGIRDGRGSPSSRALSSPQWPFRYHGLNGP